MKKRELMSLATLKEILAARGIKIALGPDGRPFVLRGRKLSSVMPRLLRVLGCWKELLIADLKGEANE